MGKKNGLKKTIMLGYVKKNLALLSKVALYLLI
jgi:hypothetical protein